METGKPETIDDYNAGFPPEKRPILEEIRATIREATPDAEEVIGCGRPGSGGAGRWVAAGALKRHGGLIPPVSGDAELEAALAPYAGEKGNLRFPLDRPIPYDLIGRIVRHKLKQNAAKKKRA